MDWIILHWQMLAGSLLVVINEVLAYNDSWKSNSVIQFVVNALKSLVGLGKPAA